MTKIFLYSSQLAAFIGRNSHTISSRIFNKLYEKYYEEQLIKMKRMDDLKSKNIGDSSLIDIIGNKLENNKDLKIKLDNLCSKNVSSFVMKKETDDLVKKVLETEKLSDNDKNLLLKAAEGYTNKTFGTIRETNVVDVYRNKMGVDVVTKLQARYKKVLEYEGNELWLISKIDAMKMDGTVLEIKNRMYKLFEEVREYEWLQVQAYLEVYNLEQAELVEFLKIGEGEMKINKIDRDRKYWEEIVINDLNKYFKAFIKIIGDSKKIKKYLDLSETEQNEMIKKLVRNSN